jgi:hypothetical protein
MGSQNQQSGGMSVANAGLPRLKAHLRVEERCEMTHQHLKACHMKKPSTRVIAILLFCAATPLSYAQLPSGNVFGGYSYLNADLINSTGTRANLNGWEASVEGKVLPIIGLVADFSGEYGRPGSIPVPVTTTCVTPVGGLPGGCILAPPSQNVSEHNFLFGPRVSFRIAKFRPFVHVLVGASHLSESYATTSSNSFADAIGGGLDYRLIPRISWRVQADALQTRFSSSTQNNVRISTGVAIQF